MTDVLCLCSDPVRRRSVIAIFRMGSSAFHGLLSRRLAHGSQSRFQVPLRVSCSQFDGFRFLPHHAHFGRSGISNRLAELFKQILILPVGLQVARGGFELRQPVPRNALQVVEQSVSL